MPEETAVVLPPGVSLERPSSGDLERGMVVNETGLPDAVVLEAVQTYFEEHASVLGANGGTQFQAFAGQQGSLLARRNQFRTPRNVIEEIILARDLAERDDDVAAAIGAIIAAAYCDGMQNTHRDEVTVALYDEIAKHANLDGVFAELHREWLIAGQITTANLFVRESFQFQPEGADRQRTRGLIAPLIGVIPAEQIRVVGNDMFGTGVLAYKPASGAQETWLQEFFDPNTSAARKAEMRREDPVLTTLLIAQMPEKDDTSAIFSWEIDDPPTGNSLYRLNPRMVERSTMPKGAWKYPRPPLTRNFPLLEAKRLLNIMDYALLQGGSNFLVVAKKGSDQRPALPQEIDNLREVVKRASQTGVMIGDHRLTIEIITPDLKELLNPSKRKLLGRKLASALLRVPDFTEEDSGGGQAVLAQVELMTRVITHDRRDLKRHVERSAYDQAAKRNSASFQNGAAKIWFPRIILQGSQYFTDYVLKMRDRGDISRRSAVEAGGFDYDAEVQSRRREKPDDRIMTPAAVPFSSPNAGPQDNGGGRPAGSGPNNGAPGAQGRQPAAQGRPTRRIAQNAGETVRAMYEEEVGTYRVGERTYALLEEYADTREIGRLTKFERDALDDLERTQRQGPLVVIPVNRDEELAELKAVRLAPGFSMIVGTRDDGALMARALSFRAPEFDGLEADEMALRLGFSLPETDSPEEQGELAPVIHLHVHGDAEAEKPPAS